MFDVSNKEMKMNQDMSSVKQMRGNRPKVQGAVCTGMNPTQQSIIQSVDVTRNMEIHCDIIVIARTEGFELTVFWGQKYLLNYSEIM